MSIDSFSSNAVRVLEVPRHSRDKPRDVKSVSDKNENPSQSQVTIIRPGDEESLKKAETFRSKSQSHSGKTLIEQQAIDAYQSIEKDQQRQNIQMLLGVDTFV
ncbi:hypothetical protein L0668_16745 [Paraglaciecola aquimarina]|uniref:Uncharacterized protein n=1 Tax=Paraglaciecola algarum TaxID=3050085 RepID=A0ABS9DA16_9ALTE|nr:hypothetical protein [Paraglaciecola sp. G1-23]MCF2949769.1 hypothetical protein [Paraglaciecola sp. G1-23]